MTDRKWKTELDLQSAQAEKALLGALGYYPDAIAGTLASLDAAAFFNPHRAAIWSVAQGLSSDRKPVEQTQIIRELVRRGAWNAAVETAMKVEMATAAPSMYAPQHAATVADLADRRRLLRAIHRAHILIEEHPGDASDVLVAVREAIAEVTPKDDGERSGGPMSWSSLVAEFEAEHDRGHERGINTPWTDFNDITGGLHGGRLYIFGARPGTGKSNVALAIAHHAALLGKPSLIISKEMPSVDVTGRIVSAGAEVDLHAVNARRLDRYDRGRIRDYTKRIGKIPLYVDARPRNLSIMRSVIRTHHQRHGLGVLVVDYLQLVRADARSRQEEVAEVSRALKELALELNCAVVVPAQLNRESTKRADGIPTMADLRDSGQIEQDADVVALLHRPLDEEGKSKLIDFIIDKNRHGQTGKFSALWKGGYATISDLRDSA